WILVTSGVGGEEVQETTAGTTAAVTRSPAVSEPDRKSLVTALEALKAEDVPELIRQAEAGDVKAQWMLGVAYADGKVVAKDYAKSWFWIQKSAATGWPIGQSAVGIAYMAGRGLDRNPEHALTLFPTHTY